MITAQPQDQTVTVGETAVFAVEVSGTNVTYQWEAQASADSKWYAINTSAAATPEYAVTAQTGHNGRRYRCAVTDRNGNTVYSDTAVLTVVPVQ